MMRSPILTVGATGKNGGSLLSPETAASHRADDIDIPHNYIWVCLAHEYLTLIHYVHTIIIIVLMMKQTVHLTFVRIKNSHDGAEIVRLTPGGVLSSTVIQLLVCYMVQ